MRQFFEWGSSFQLRLLSLLVKHPQESYELIEPGYFSDPIQVDIARVVKDVYRGKLNSHLSKSTLLALVKSTLKKSDKQYWSTYRETIRKIFRYPLADKDILLGQAAEFAKETLHREALIQVEKDITAHKYNSIVRRFQELEDFGKERDLGIVYWDDIKSKDRYRGERSEVVPTGLKKLDKYMGGGPGGGELVIIEGGGKVGKTTALCNVAAGGLKYGKNIAIATAELSAKKYRKRIDSLISQHPANDFHKRAIRDDVIEKLQAARRVMKGQIYIKQWPTGKGSVTDIENWLSDLDREEIKIDVLIVDYTRIFNPSVKSKELRLNLGQVCVDLRGIAVERDIPVWTASQPNRAGLDKEVLGPQDLAEDVSQFWTTDFLIALCQTKVERENVPPRGRILLVAARDVGRGGVIHIDIDYTTYKISERNKKDLVASESEK